MRKLAREEDGVSSIEYALLAGMIAVVIVAAVTVLGGSVKSLFDSVGALWP